MTAEHFLKKSVTNFYMIFKFIPVYMIEDIEALFTGCEI